MGAAGSGSHAGGRGRKVPIEELKRAGTYSAYRHAPKLKVVKSRLPKREIGPRKGLDGWPPRWLSAVEAEEIARGDGAAAVEFIEMYCRVTKDSIAGLTRELLRLRGWQVDLINRLLARRQDGMYRHRQALIGMGRKNGKSTFIAGLGLYALLNESGGEGREIYSCAAEKEQARIIFGTARRMVELDPRLQEKVELYRDAIVVPETGSTYRVLSAEAYSKEGLNPTHVLFDEVHNQPTRELWEVMALASGSRQESLMVGVTTAGVRFEKVSGKDSLCYQLYEHGQRVATGEEIDPSFFFAWWEPAEAEADHSSPATWKAANPGFADVVSLEDFEFTLRNTPEAAFRIKRCNQWVTAAEAWLPAGVWDACKGQRVIPDGASVVLGFDGSHSNDSTALVACEVAEVPQLEVVRLWEKPPVTLEPNWRVPVFEVEDAIRAACRKYNVLEIACDPFRWTPTIQALQADNLPVLEFPQTSPRMTPATQGFYEAVVNRQLTHSGDSALARHIGNAVLKVDSRGMRIVKESLNSSRKIDLAVAALMAFDRASWHAATPQRVPLMAYGS